MSSINNDIFYALYDGSVTSIVPAGNSWQVSVRYDNGQSGVYTLDQVNVNPCGRVSGGTILGTRRPPGVTNTVTLNTRYSITGGGALTEDKTLNLVNDVAAPANLQYYGTDNTGVRGWHDLPDFSLPIATNTILGGVKIGANISVTADGTISVAAPVAQVNADWNASSGVSQILNKPTIPAAQVNTDWNASSGISQLLNKPTLATVATTGSYTDLSNKPTIPTNNNQLTNGMGYITTAAHTHGIADATGTQQFTFGIGDNIRFEAIGSASVAFDAATKKVTISATAGSGADGNKFITDFAFTGTDTKTLTATFNDSTTISRTFTDLQGSGGTTLTAPTSEVVFGTGTGTTSSPSLTWNGNLNIGANGMLNMGTNDWGDKWYMAGSNIKVAMEQATTSWLFSVKGVTSLNKYRFQGTDTTGTPPVLLDINFDGSLKVPAYAGADNRMLIAGIDGTIGTQATPTGGGFTPSGTSAQYIRGDGTYAAFPTIPTNNNQLTNGMGYITTAAHTHTVAGNAKSFTFGIGETITFEAGSGASIDLDTTTKKVIISGSVGSAGYDQVQDGSSNLTKRSVLHVNGTYGTEGLYVEDNSTGAYTHMGIDLPTVQSIKSSGSTQPLFVDTPATVLSLLMNAGKWLFTGNVSLNNFGGSGYNVTIWIESSDGIVLASSTLSPSSTKCTLHISTIADVATDGVYYNLKISCSVSASVLGTTGYSSKDAATQFNAVRVGRPTLT